MALRSWSRMKKSDDRNEQEGEGISLREISKDEKKYKLLNLQYTKPGSRLFSLANVLTRMENISYILAWSLIERKNVTGR
jgi:hypothetical protein